MLVATGAGNHVIKCQSVRERISFSLEPDGDARAELARALGVRGLRKVKLVGRLSPDGDLDLRLDARLGATVLQDCVATGNPVTTRIEEQVIRLYVHDLPVPDGDEVEMAADENADPMPTTLDLEEVLAEALALALPPWPRIKDVEPVRISVSEPGKTPMTDEDARPFAALKSLQEKTSDTGRNQG